MRIGMILDGVFPPDPRVENEAISLINAGHEVFLFCLDFGGTGNVEEEYNGIRVCRYHVPKFVRSVSALAYTVPLYHWFLKALVNEFLMKNPIDVIHIHDIQVARTVFTLNRKFKKKVVLDLHENRPEIMKFYRHVNNWPGRVLIYPSVWKKFEYNYIKEADRVIVVTEEAKNHYLSEIDVKSEKFVVVPNSVLPAFYTEPLIDQHIVARFKDRFCLLYLGNTGLRRGLATVIDAMKNLVSEIPNIHLVVVGKSKADTHLLQMSRNENLDSYISFEGWQDPALFPSYIEACDIGVSPLHKNLHHDTTYANKVFQYMSLGLPVIASDCDAQARIINESKSGLIFRERDTNDFAEKVLELYRNNIFYRYCSINGMTAVRDHLNWNKISSGLVNMYARI